MVDRTRLRRRRGQRRAWLAAVGTRLDQAAALVDALAADGVAVPALEDDIEVARMMVNALSAANGS